MTRQSKSCAAYGKYLQGKLNFEIHWIAYQLQPLAPPEGVPKAVFMEQKFKGQAQYLMKKKQVLNQNIRLASGLGRKT